MAEKEKPFISIEGWQFPPGTADVTPEDSEVPVYLIPITKEESAELKRVHDEQNSQEKLRVKNRDSALAKLAKLGLTSDEISAFLP